MHAAPKFLGWLLTIGAMAISIAVNGGVSFVAYGQVLAVFMILFTAVLDGVRVVLAQQFARHKLAAGSLYIAAMILAWALLHFSYIFAVTAQAKPDEVATRIEAEIAETERKVLPGRRTPEAIRSSRYCVTYPSRDTCTGVVYNKKEKAERLAELDIEQTKVEESLRGESKLQEQKNALALAKKNALERSSNKFALNVPALQSALAFLPFIISMVVELGIVAGAWAISSPIMPRRQSAPERSENNPPKRQSVSQSDTHFSDWLHNSWLSQKGEDGWAWYIQREIAAASGISGSGRVCTLLQLLEAQGSIELRTRAGRGARTGIKFRTKLSIIK